jgi:hypothetical protein
MNPKDETWQQGYCDQCVVPLLSCYHVFYTYATALQAIIRMRIDGDTIFVKSNAGELSRALVFESHA